MSHAVCSLLDIAQKKINLYENIASCRLKLSLGIGASYPGKQYQPKVEERDILGSMLILGITRNFPSLQQLPGHLLVVDQCLSWAFAGSRGRARLESQREC